MNKSEKDFLKKFLLWTNKKFWGYPTIGHGLWQGEDMYIIGPNWFYDAPFAYCATEKGAIEKAYNRVLAEAETHLKNKFGDVKLITNEVGFAIELDGEIVHSQGDETNIWANALIEAFKKNLK